jgi:hypothetical protein
MTALWSSHLGLRTRIRGQDCRRDRPLLEKCSCAAEGLRVLPCVQGNLMESVKKAQQLVQTETARVQAELAA